MAENTSIFSNLLLAWSSAFEAGHEEAVGQIEAGLCPQTRVQPLPAPPRPIGPEIDELEGVFVALGVLLHHRLVLQLVQRARGVHDAANAWEGQRVAQQGRLEVSQRPQPPLVGRRVPLGRSEQVAHDSCRRKREAYTRPLLTYRTSNMMIE